MKALIASIFLHCCLGQQQSPSAALGALHVEIDRAEFEEAQVPSSLLVRQRRWCEELLKSTDVGKPFDLLDEFSWETNVSSCRSS